MSGCLSRLVCPPSSSSTPSTATSTAPSQPTTIPNPEIKVYPDALYINYHSLGISFCCLPVQVGVRLQAGSWKAEEVRIDSIDLYNPRPKPQGLPDGRRRARGPEWKKFTGLPMDMPTKGIDEESTTFPLTATTTGKALVSALGEPSRKGGGIGWVDVWLEWELSSMSGIGIHVSLEDPRGDEEVDEEQQRRGLGGVWDRAGHWIWGVCKLYDSSTSKLNDSVGGS
ncbi:hypothetical protein QFC22_000661 [Naganishia vaughanmartiniae]|uniref:Uncharacterized protein n=1 Tax=Naganishia vaughanmartiniae TaxID=1424756 RepID=A0ACC2XPB2_9TREE|nr:hypothetical protein QFC22_000661 [Naganishia vaughanmartiniae]